MLIKILPDWHIPEREAAPESVYLSRRRFLSAAALGGAALLAGCESEPGRRATPSDGLFPAPRNPVYTLDRPVTAEALTSRYNNFYEFGSSKQISAAAAYLKTRPWEIVIDGEVDKPITIGIDDLLKKVPLEERLYRHRCVETWAMAVPWTGFALKHLLALAQPKLGTRYVLFTSFSDSSVARGQLQFWYPWPYKEGLTIAEANHELAFLVSGIYGKPLSNQFGAPLRLAVPWKYGFKSIKSITRVTFTSQRPLSFWEQSGGGEYGFWANVNPEVPHPRWSQAKERVLGESFQRPTQLFNGYGPQVASLYAGMEGQQLYR
jgi:sulfoxide reductase catalytic subunit YedY